MPPSVGRTAVAGAEPGATASSLCEAVPRLSVLVVDRTVELPLNRYRFSFPARVVVDRPSDVRPVARALCALPTMPTGLTNCPADVGIVYHLDFSSPRRKFGQVFADASGCEQTTGVTTVALRATTAFWNALGKAMRLAPQRGAYPYGYPFGARGVVTTYIPPTASGDRPAHTRSGT